jgi:hypothetical protein
MPTIYQMRLRFPALFGSVSLFVLYLVGSVHAIQTADRPDFEDYRRAGRVVRNYSRGGDNNTYGVTLQLRENSVRNLAGGVVHSIGKLRGYGQFVIVDHGKGWHTLYSNVGRIGVTRGQRLARGAIIGTPRRKRLFLVVSYRGNPINPSETIGKPMHEEHTSHALHALVSSGDVK